MNKIDVNSLEIFKTNHYVKSDIGLISNNAYLSIVATNNCQRKCPYCINSDTDHKLNMPIDKAISNISKLVSKYDMIQEAIILGGEPLLHPNIVQLIKKLNNNTGLKKIRLTTNAIALINNDNLIKEIFNPIDGLYGINISSHNNEDFMTYDKLKEICFKIKTVNPNIKIRINSNIYINNLDNIDEILKHIQIISEFSDEMRISNIIPKDDFSVNNINHADDLILSNKQYEDLFNQLINHYADKYTIIENDKTLGFVKYLLIPAKFPIIINWNINSTVAEQICENDINNRFINTFKCLVNGEISLSWNNSNIINI